MVDKFVDSILARLYLNHLQLEELNFDFKVYFSSEPSDLTLSFLSFKQLTAPSISEILKESLYTAANLVDVKELQNPVEHRVEVV